MTVRIGCQTYTWQMSYDKYAGQIPHILDVIQGAGFAGFEPEVCMLGDYNRDPALLKNELHQRNLTLGALCLAQAWLLPELTDGEREEAHRTLQYIKQFPGAMLVLVQLPGMDRTNLEQRQRNAIANMNEVARLAHENGIICAYHPNSPNGSIFRTEEDYKVLLNGMNPVHCGYAPDTGHIAKGGMNVIDILKTYRSLIRHVHFKDIQDDGEWTAMGKGIIDHPEIVGMLRETAYDGWIMVEEESKRAKLEPDKVTLENGQYVQSYLL